MSLKVPNGRHLAAFADLRSKLRHIQFALPQINEFLEAFFVDVADVVHTLSQRPDVVEESKRRAEADRQSTPLVKILDKKFHELSKYAVLIHERRDTTQALQLFAGVAPVLWNDSAPCRTESEAQVLCTSLVATKADLVALIGLEHWSQFVALDELRYIVFEMRKWSGLVGLIDRVPLELLKNRDVMGQVVHLWNNTGASIFHDLAALSTELAPLLCSLRPTPALVGDVLLKHCIPRTRGIAGSVVADSTQLNQKFDVAEVFVRAKLLPYLEANWHAIEEARAEVEKSAAPSVRYDTRMLVGLFKVLVPHAMRLFRGQEPGGASTSAETDVVFANFAASVDNVCDNILRGASLAEVGQQVTGMAQTLVGMSGSSLQTSLAGLLPILPAEFAPVVQRLVCSSGEGASCVANPQDVQELEKLLAGLSPDELTKVFGVLHGGGAGL